MDLTKRKRRIITITIFAVILLNIFFLQLSVNSKVKAAYIPIRTEASADSTVKYVIAKDSDIVILQKKGDWTQVYVNAETGWVENANLSSDQIDAAKATKKVTPTKSAVPYFKDSRSTDKKLGDLAVNAEYLRYYDKNGWSQIVTSNGELAWVQSDSLVPVETHTQPTVAVSQKEYPSEKMIKVKRDTSLLSGPGTGTSLEIMVKGEALFATDSTQQNGYYLATSASGITGYVRADNVEYLEKLEQRVGTKATSLSGATIVLDAGHGGLDGGAVSSGTDKVVEKEVALLTAQTVKQVLESAGATVIMTRINDVDISLEKRSEITNQNKADVFISLHYDSADTTDFSGTTVHYLFYEDTRLADIFNEQFKSLPLKANGTKISNFQVLRDSNAPALLLELGYMNKNEDVEIFKTNEYRDQVAKSILTALDSYFKK